MNGIYLGLGTNLGDRQENLQNALKNISLSIGEIVAQSSIHETKAWGKNGST